MRAGGLRVRAWMAGMVAVAAACAAGGCDFDKQLEECAASELCTLDSGVPILRFPFNGAGLGSPTADLPLAGYTPLRPYLAWEFDGDEGWVFRAQLNECDAGTSLAQCPFPGSRSTHQLDLPAAYWAVDSDLEVGRRYWWRVRACDTDKPGSPCGPWSAPRYFDIGRPEAIRNDFDGTGRSDMAVAGRDAGNSGAQEKVYLYTGTNNGPAFSKELLVGPATSLPANYEVVVAGAGDLDGDGYSDLAVGYRLTDLGVAQPTGVELFYGGPQGPDAGRRSTLGPYPDDFGAALGRAGDVNGDGLSDLVVCQRLQERAVIFLGHATRVVSSPNGDAQLYFLDADLGKPLCAFAALGDVNADGYDDIAVGGTGQLLVFQGRSDTGSWGPLKQVPAPPGASDFGSSMAGGDLNGDGHGDLVVAGGNNKAYLYLGGPHWAQGVGFPEPVAFDVPAGMVIAAGDVNNDGFADLAVGGGMTRAVRVYFGREDLGKAGAAPRPGPVLQDTQLPSFGISFAGVGDLTDDGYEDVAVGSSIGVLLFRGAAADGDVGTLVSPLLPPAGSVGFGNGVSPGY